MRIVFLGTPDFAVPSLSALSEKYEVAGVITQPDREKDRKGKTSGSRIAYRHSATGKCLLMHSPHPKKELKPYMVAQVIAFLESVSEI